MKPYRALAILAAASAALLMVPHAKAADADVTGLVPTLWWDFETRPSAANLATANKGSASIAFTSEGSATYRAGVTNGWAADTSVFTPYSAANGAFSTVGGAYTVSLVMNLGTTKNGITLNVRNETGQRDLIVRRGSTAGSLVVGCDTWKVATKYNLAAEFEDDSTYHLVSVVVEDTGISLYVDGEFVDSTTEYTPWTASGRASRLQFGSHLSGVPGGEAKGGGCIDDMRIHDAALTPGQMKAIAVELGLVTSDGMIAIVRRESTTVGMDSFQTAFNLLLDDGDAAEAAIVYGTDAALSAPATNVIGSALPVGNYEATLSGLASGTTYWWKLVASNGVNRAETDVDSFRTLDMIVATNYAWRAPTTISGYVGSSTLTNFPVLVKLAAGAPAGFDYADCAEDGADIRFAATDGHVLAHEIDTWNTNGESLVWVKIPEISGTATAFSMYYGASDMAALPPVDPHDVWTASGHRAVWHFAADATESAQGLVASTATGTPSYGVNGAVGKCWYSAGTAWLQYANDTSWSALGKDSTLTISAWAKFDSNSYGFNRILSTMSNWEKPAGYELTIQNNRNQITVGSSGKSQYQKIVSPGPSDELVYLTAVYNADFYADLYVNGVQVEHKLLNPLVQPTETMTVACLAGGGNVWNGRLDELRLHATAESADWVKACYDTMVAPTTFAALSPAESTDPAVPQLGALSASDANCAVTFSVQLTRPGYGGEVPTAVSVFYGTDGENWTELALGSTNAVATLTGAATGLAGNTVYLWYAAATATRGGVDKSVESAWQTIRTGQQPAPETYKTFTATVEYEGAAATNVPVLLRLSESAITGFDYDDVTASCFEIVDASGNLLPWEIDTWDENGESLVWVRLPVWEDGATIAVRYGVEFANTPSPASETWADYVGVWHLNDTNSASAYGSYPNSTATAGIDGEKAQASIAGDAGVFGKSVKVCDATKQGAGYQLGGVFVPDSGDNSPVDLGSTFTISGWFRHKNQDYYYDKLFAKRGKANNDAGVPPTGAFATEMGANGPDNKLSVFGGGGTYQSVNLKSTLHDTWSYLTFIYDGSTASVYRNGALCGSGTVNPVTDNDGRLCFGNMTGGYGDGTGDAAWCGWIDEVRLADATPSAAWVAAEYAAMADPAALSYGRATTVDAATPGLSAPTVARNADGSFTVSVVVSENVPRSVAALIGGASYTMSTSDSELPMDYSAVVSDLADGTYTVTVRAESTTGNEAYSDCRTAFHAGALTVTNISDADEGSLTPGSFRVSRADVDATGLPALTFDVAFSGDGLAAVIAPGTTFATIPAGAAYVDISLIPVLATGVTVDTQVTMTVSGSNIGMPSSGTLTVVNADYDVSVRYVATDGADTNHGGTPELPKKTIASALSSLANIAQTRHCTVHVAPGLYPISSPLIVTNAISVLGGDADPSRTIVSNTVIGGWGAKNRVFTINHTDALVANITMQKGNVNGSDHGGNFNVGSAGGTVSNCVVEAGSSNGNLYGAGGRLSGGLVTHTVFRKNVCHSGMGNWQGQRGAVLELAGSSRAENCLLVDNPPSGTLYLILLDGSSVMRNCTIADTVLKSTNEYCKVFTALRINSVNAKALNTVIAGVTNAVDGAACPPTGAGVSNFLNGAFDGDVTGLPEGTVTGTAAQFFKNHVRGDYRPRSSGPLVGAGANYEGMADVDLSGARKRLVGRVIDIGAYEGEPARTVLIIK